MKEDLLQLALRLATEGPGKPKQAVLRRAVSTAYYALFHAVASMCADMMVGAAPASRPERAWQQVYRALNHGTARSGCEGLRNLGFPREIEICADRFVELQKARHAADYDPSHRLTREEALEMVRNAREGVDALKAAPIKDRRAFAVQLHMRRRS